MKKKSKKRYTPEKDFTKPNPFENIYTKRKHNVIGQKNNKTNSGLNTQNRSVANEKRQKSLLIDFADHKKNTFIDRRIIKSHQNKNKKEEQLRRNLMIFQSKRKKKMSLFNIDDSNDPSYEYLTHDGLALTDSIATTDGMEEEAVEEEFFKMTKRPLNDIILKSKMAKLEKKEQRSTNEGLIDQADSKFDSIRDSLFYRTQSTHIDDKDTDYLSIYQQLNNEARVSASDRIKTNEEIASAQYHDLKQKERERQERTKEENFPLSPIADDDTNNFEESVNEYDDSIPSYEPKYDFEDDIDDYIPNELKKEKNELESPSIIEQLPPKKIITSSDLPYTYTMPDTYDQFCSLLYQKSLFFLFIYLFREIDDQKLIIQRLLSCYHISLSKSNEQYLTIFYNYLINYFLQTTNMIQNNDKEHIKVDVSQIFMLCQALRVLSAQIPQYAVVYCRKFLSSLSIQTNLPTSSQLLLLETFIHFFPTSDKQHLVLDPFFILLTQYLQHDIKISQDCLKLFFCSSILISCCSENLRYFPEIIMFLQNVLVILSSKSIDISSPYSYPSISTLFFSSHDPFFNSDEFFSLLFSSVLISLFQIIDIYHDMPSFPEIFQPFPSLLSKFIVDTPSHTPSSTDDVSTISHHLTTLISSLKSLLIPKSRTPLSFLQPKPKSIPSYEPKFDFEGDVDDYKPNEPEKEKKRLKSFQKKVNQERKSAIREITKDNRFINREKTKLYQKEQKKKKIEQARIRRILSEE